MKINGNEVTISFPSNVIDVDGKKIYLKTILWNELDLESKLEEIKKYVPKKKKEKKQISEE